MSICQHGEWSMIVVSNAILNCNFSSMFFTLVLFLLISFKYMTIFLCVIMVSMIFPNYVACNSSIYLDLSIYRFQLVKARLRFSAYSLLSRYILFLKLLITTLVFCQNFKFHFTSAHTYSSTCWTSWFTYILLLSQDFLFNISQIIIVFSMIYT